jgi:signal transduction histidine kinase
VIRLAERTRRPLTAGQAAWASTSFAVFFGGLSWLSIAGAQWDAARILFWTDLVLGVASLVAMQFRHRWPFAVTMLTAAATAVSLTAAGAWVVCQASLATRRRWREILPTAAVAVLTGQVWLAAEPGQHEAWYANLLFCLLGAGAVVAIGMYVGARRDLVASRRDRAERAEREQALEIAAARAGERTRIAREMHDVLAHRMSLVALHAGALAYRTDLTPDQTRETADTIQANSRRALADLRTILGLLRDPERGVDATDHRPQPTLADLDCLLDDERAAGARITVHCDLDDDLGALPESTGRNAYRIVQEGLTNARKHAPHATVTVELTGRPGRGLALSISNPVGVGAGTPHGGDGAGYGLIGLAERAAASRGRVGYDSTPDGNFVLRAWLPWEG